MIKFYAFCVLFALISVKCFGQLPGSVSVNAGADQVLSCATNCTNLTAVPFQIGTTSSYSVVSIPHIPPVAYTSTAGTVLPINTDDGWGANINLPFTFCYFGTIYNSIKVGPNGGIKFNPISGGQQLVTSGFCPSASLIGAGDIFGVYQDLDPSVIIAPNTLNANIRYHVLGAAPNRVMCISYNEIPQYTCATRATHMVVLYETSNVIDIYVEKKPLCAGANLGSAIIGIQNPTGTLGFSAPSRNAAPNWIVSTPEAWRFLPNGATTYSIAWFNGATPVGSGATVNVCPTAQSTTYTCKVTYFKCNGTTTIIQDNVVVSYGVLASPTVAVTAETCNNYNNGAVVINNAFGAGPFTVDITGPFSGTFNEANTATAEALFSNLPDGAYGYNVVGNHGCTTNGSFSISAGGNCCSVAVNTTSNACNNVNTGTAIAVPAGVLAPIAYSWASPSSINQSLTGIGAGTYTVTATDASGCVATASGIVINPPALSITTSAINPACSGNCNGVITVSANGGVGTLLYKLNFTGTYAASNVFSNLCSGTYTVYVKDANNCETQLNVTLVYPNPIIVSLVNSSVPTCANSNGSISVSAIGGNGPYSYSVNNGIDQSTGFFPGLPVGSYNVRVEGQFGCFGELVVPIISNGNPTASILTQNNVTCFSAANGEVLIGVVGGSTPVNYSIDNGFFQPSNSFTGLNVGPHSVVVTDPSGCTSTVNFTITQPSQMNYTAVATPASCFGECTGSIVFSASGGTGPYTFSAVGTFFPTTTFSNLCPTTYATVARDSEGCLRNISVVVGQASQILVSSTNIEPLCHDDCNGNVLLAATGGTAGYTYAENSGVFGSTFQFSNLCPGSKTYRVKDALGCIVNYTTTLANPLQINVDTLYTVSSNCGSANGAIAFTASGLYDPFEYSLNNGPFNSSGIFPGLTGGAYTIRVRDQLGCINELYYGINDVEMTGVLINITPSTCFNSEDGTIEVGNVNGALPVSYALDNGSPINGGFFAQLSSEDHIIVLADNGLCVYTFPFEIAEPDTILFQTTITPISCNGLSDGSLTFTNVTGGNGTYGYSVDGSAYQSSPTFNNIALGSHTLSVIDINLCSGTGTAVMTQPLPLTINSQGFDLNCNNDASGFVLLAGFGGTGGAAGMTFNIDNSTIFTNSTGGFPGLSAGTYTTKVKDINGCIAAGSVTINQPAPLVAIYTMTPATCFGLCDGRILATLSGGTAPYQYSNNAGIDFQINNISTGLCAGTIQKLDRDFNNCSFFSSIVVTQPAQIDINNISTGSTCGLANGSISLTATGGTGAYQFSILTPSIFSTQSNYTALTSTTYVVKVKDVNNCEALDIVQISNTVGPSINGITIVNPACFNDCNGSVTVSIVGGTAPMSYSLGSLPVQSSNQFVNLCSGTYTLTVVDAIGCSSTQQVTLTNPSQLAFTHTFTDLTCSSNNTGSIDFNATGGTLPYSFSVNNFTTFSTTNVIGALAANTYPLEVRDFRGCSVTGSQIISEPLPIVISPPTITNASCNALCDGSIVLAVSGGTVAGTYNYVWSTNYLPSSNSSLSNVCAGVYTVSVNDDNNCSANRIITISEPVSLDVDLVTYTAPTCFSLCDGTIQITSNSAVEYSLNNQTSYTNSNLFTNLCDASHVVYFRNSNGCFNSYTIDLEEPQLLTQPSLAQNATILCEGADFGLTSSADGGTAPYYFVWSTGDTSEFLNQTILNATTITCTVYDFNGCVSNTLSASATIYPAFSASASMLTLACPGTATNILASGIDGLPNYNYQWLNLDLDTLGAGSSFSFSALATDSLFLVGHDACNSYDTIVVPFPVFSIGAPTFSVDKAIGCLPLTTQFTVSTMNQANSTFQWDFGDGVAATGNSTAHTANTVGCYDVKLIMTSPQGCISDTLYTDVVCINPNPVPDFDFAPTAPTNIENVVRFGNATPGVNTYAWDFSTFGNSNIENPTHTFVDVTEEIVNVCLTAATLNGCFATKCKPIKFIEELEFYAPNTFTPNDDASNPMFRPIWSKNLVFEDYSFEIYNRWGQMVFQTNDIQEAWDGTFKGSESQIGTYQWVVKVSGIDKKRASKYTGNVNLLK